MVRGGTYRKVMRVPAPSQAQMIENIEQKRYLHFDALLAEEELLRIVNDPSAVAKNKFYPFLGYVKEVERFSGSLKGRAGQSRKTKKRDIRYASRRDAAIFQTYRKILLPLYEDKLRTAGIDEVAIAYRKIPVPDRPQSGKCNIHHACDVFCAIKEATPCLAIALDISGFFESIDHAKLYRLWCELLNVSKLPADHLAVFKNITRYSVIDLDAALKIVPKPSDYRQVQLCSPAVFREKIAPLAKQHKEAFGIPQGSPISDLLANLALLNFDIAVDRYVKNLKGIYRRYSDDIILILPIQDNMKHQEAIDQALAFVDQSLHASGESLHIKPTKTCIGIFKRSGHAIDYTPLRTGVVGEDFKNKPFEYLGFSFDGKRVLLRNSTMSGFYRKLVWHTASVIRECIRRFPNKKVDDLRKDITPDKVIERFLKIEDFREKADAYENWTFWSYAKRCHEVMARTGQLQSGILRQLARIRIVIRKTVNAKLQDIYIRVKRAPSLASRKRSAGVAAKTPEVLMASASPNILRT